MKKIIMSALLMGLLVVSSCKKKEDAVTGPSSVAGTATIKGVAKAERNNNVAGKEVKGSAIILAIYNSGDLVLNPVPGTVYPDVTLSATTGSDGSYSFTIPTNGRAVDVSIKPQDFIDNVTEFAAVGVIPNVLLNQLFTSPQIDLVINEKEAIIRDIAY